MIFEKFRLISGLRGKQVLPMAQFNLSVSFTALLAKHEEIYLGCNSRPENV